MTENIWSEVEHGFFENDGVKLHYAATGEGPLVVMIHGFPDFWYSWRHQMAGLREHFRVVALDQRAYNLSDAPERVEDYDIHLLASDIAELVRHLGEEKATIVGHDWGGMVAWNVAFRHSQLVRNLVVLNLPHPNGMARVWADNEAALAGTDYARKFRQGQPGDPDIFFGYPMTAESLSGWVRDRAARQKYVEAFELSDFTGMLNYYKQNYPDIWSPDHSPPPPLPPLDISTLMFHGLEDAALHSDGLNNTWDWISRDLTLVTIPGADHFVQQDAAELVTNTMHWWLLARQ